MTTDDSDNGWDSLAEEFGIADAKEPPKPDKPAAVPSRPAGRPGSSRPARDPRPEVEQDADDFGSGLTAGPARDQAPLYDPGPDAVAEEDDDFGEAPEPLDEAEEGEDRPPTTEGVAEGQEGGKKRRRRRRRRKKGGGAAETEEAEAGEAGGEPADVEAELVNGVEEGEAPAEVEGDDDEEAPASAVDEEMDAEVAMPRNEWHVMSWNELVAKLYRPG